MVAAKPTSTTKKVQAAGNGRSVDIVPAVLATGGDEFDQEILAAAKISNRVHIDVTDGQFAKQQTVNLAQIYWGDSDTADLHLMMDHVAEHQEQLISMRPDLVIIHFEAADGTRAKRSLMADLQAAGIRAGIAVLQTTAVSEAEELIKAADHALVFTGHLGSYGGKMSKESLPKIAAIKDLKPDIEVSVDGGVNDKNAKRVVRAGADVLVTGSYTVGSDHPKRAYEKLQRAAEAAL